MADGGVADRGEGAAAEPASRSRAPSFRCPAVMSRPPSPGVHQGPLPAAVQQPEPDRGGALLHSPG